MERLSPAGREMLILASGAWDAALGRPAPMLALGPGIKVVELRLCFTVPCAPRPALPRTAEAPWRGALVAWLRADGRAVAPRDARVARAFWACGRLLRCEAPRAECRGVWFLWAIGAYYVVLPANGPRLRLNRYNKPKSKIARGMRRAPGSRVGLEINTAGEHSS